MKALTLALLLVASTASAAKPEQPQKLYCAVDKSVAYFATFDSGDNDRATCQVTAKMWEMFLASQQIKAKCWCTQVTQA